jgi:hypothetical protein
MKQSSRKLRLCMHALPSVNGSIIFSRTYHTAEFQDPLLDVVIQSEVCRTSVLVLFSTGMIFLHNFTKNSMNE